MIYVVYEIKIDDIRRYVGMTNNITRREKEHNRGLRAGDSKLLYKNLLEIGRLDEIKLEVLYEYNTKTQAVRMEALLILEDWFSDKRLWQVPPRVIKYI